MTMNTIARIDSSNTRTTRGISDRTVCNTNREHKSCTLLSSSSSLCFSVFEKCEFLLSIEREKKRGKEGRHQNEQKTIDLHFPPRRKVETTRSASPAIARKKVEEAMSRKHLASLFANRALCAARSHSSASTGVPALCLKNGFTANAMSSGTDENRRREHQQRDAGTRGA